MVSNRPGPDLLNRSIISLPEQARPRNPIFRRQKEHNHHLEGMVPENAANEALSQIAPIQYPFVFLTSTPPSHPRLNATQGCSRLGYHPQSMFVCHFDADFSSVAARTRYDAAEGDG